MASSYDLVTIFNDSNLQRGYFVIPYEAIFYIRKKPCAEPSKTEVRGGSHSLAINWNIWQSLIQQRYGSNSIQFSCINSYKYDRTCTHLLTGEWFSISVIIWAHGKTVTLGDVFRMTVILVTFMLEGNCMPIIVNHR